MRGARRATTRVPTQPHATPAPTATSGGVMEGETIEEAIAIAKDAIRLHIEGLVADGQSVPQEFEHPQAIVIDVAA